MDYAGFWPRFAALWLDILFLSPVFGLVLWGEQHFRLFSIYYFLPALGLSLFYSVYLVRRFGGTPGKRVMKVRILKVDGSPVGYREAFLRYLPECLMSTLSAVTMIVAVLHLSDAEYFALSLEDRSTGLRGAQPAWSGPLELASNLWVWGEFIVLMTNSKRRALHDFIAGTVVVRDEAAS
jgi:uncharacterized RDD family membrane protein YckC